MKKKLNIPFELNAKKWLFNGPISIYNTTPKNTHQFCLKIESEILNWWKHLYATLCRHKNGFLLGVCRFIGYCSQFEKSKQNLFQRILRLTTDFERFIVYRIPQILENSIHYCRLLWLEIFHIVCLNDIFYHSNETADKLIAYFYSFYPQQIGYRTN